MNPTKTLLAVVVTIIAGAISSQAQDQALLNAERSRGVMTGGTGVQWTVSVQSSGSDNRRATFRATSQGGKTFAEVLSPESAKGRKYLAEAGGTMWFMKPELSRPVSIPRRQRLSGDAAIGDLASTSYVKGYKVAGQADDQVNGEAATVYTLKANSLSDTYAQIRYWVTKSGNLGKKAEFYTRGGQLVRSATMSYGNRAGGRPFLSSMTIQDGSRTIRLRYSNVKISSFPSSMFTKSNLSAGSR